MDIFPISISPKVFGAIRRSIRATLECNLNAPGKWQYIPPVHGATCFCLDASPLVPLSCIGMPYLQTEHCTPYPVAKFESIFFHNTLLLQRDSLLKGAFKWPKFSLTISAHCYYTETLHEFNILASFLKRIWVQLSKSFSELKIVWFLWHLDQKIVFVL